jgi:signal transduction histidine kinase
MLTLYVDIAQCVIFLSYFVISCIVGYVYSRHKHYIDSRGNRMLSVTACLFLMLCALTHLFSLQGSEPPEILLFLCALVSFASAVCTVYSFRGLDDYLRQRVAIMQLMKEEVITNLTKGYDLKVVVSKNAIVSGVAGSIEISEPVYIREGFHINRIIKIEDKYFRIANIVDSFVEMSAHSDEPRYNRRQSHIENGNIVPATVGHIYGHDATAEVHMRRETERMNDMKIGLCMTTAHHVRTPLSCLGIALTSLGSRVQSEESVRMVDEAFVHLEIINMIVTQFVDVATLDSSVTTKPCVEYVDIREIVGRVEKVLLRIMTEGVRCTCSVDDCVPKFVLTDGVWILQLLLNLVTNATSYTYSGWIDVSVTLVPDSIKITVADTGVGIPETEKRDIFEKGFISNTMRGHGSTGIELFSVNTKVVALGGECRFVNNPNGGTIVSLTVPVATDKKCYARATENKSQSVQISLVRSVLVVDDTPIVRKIMRRYLRDHRVEVACNGEEALVKMKQQRFDIVLLDIIMPVMDGLECLKAFREWERHNRPRDDRQQVVCVSATTIALDPDFDGFIPKPMDTRRLQQLLQTLS